MKETLKGDIPREDIEKENEDAFADVMARLKSIKDVVAVERGYAKNGG